MSNPVFTPWVDEHDASLYRFALSLARRELEACDRVQQPFYNWAMKGEALRKATKAKAWLFTTLDREFLRGRQRDARASSIENLPPGEQGIAAEEVDRGAKVDAATVVVALQSVDEPCRAPRTRFDREDWAVLAIAEALGGPIGPVMSRLARGKAPLRAALQREAAEGKSNVVAFHDAARRTQA